MIATSKTKRVSPESLCKHRTVNVWCKYRVFTKLSHKVSQVKQYEKGFSFIYMENLLAYLAWEVFSGSSLGHACPLGNHFWGDRLEKQSIWKHAIKFLYLCEVSEFSVWCLIKWSCSHIGAFFFLIVTGKLAHSPIWVPGYCCISHL